MNNENEQIFQIIPERIKAILNTNHKILGIERSKSKR